MRSIRSSTKSILFAAVGGIFASGAVISVISLFALSGFDSPSGQLEIAQYIAIWWAVCVAFSLLAVGVLIRGKSIYRYHKRYLRRPTMDRVHAKGELVTIRVASISKAYRVGAVITFFVVFVCMWIYCITTYGYLLGGGLGWLPALVVGAIAALLWPLLAIVVIAGLYYLIFQRYFG